MPRDDRSPSDDVSGHASSPVVREATKESQRHAPLEMKPLAQAYQEGEKDTAAESVTIDGEEVQVHEKDWLRHKTDAKRAAEGKSPVTDEVWRANVATTQYMNEAQREEHRMHFRPGHDETGAENMRVSGGSLQKGGNHIFVMDGEGQVFAKEGQAALDQKDDTGRSVHVHHSSFLAGEAVAGAGEVKVDNQGFIKEVTDRSGHYLPGEQQTQQTLEELENKGVNLDNVKFTMDRGEEKTTGMANEFRKGGEKVFKARHTVADEIKKRGESVKEALDHDAGRRATRVRKVGEHLGNGRQYDEISRAAAQHAKKDEQHVGGEVKAGMKDQLGGKSRSHKAAKTIRAALQKPGDGDPSAPPKHAIRRGVR